MKSNVKTVLILVVMIVTFVVGISSIFSYIEMNNDPSLNFQNKTNLKMDKSNFKKAPTLTGISNYININSEELQNKIDGNVVLYDIWTYSCINCIRTLPYITAWNEKYADEGLLIIGVHSPEFEFEKDVNNVEIAVNKHDITYPVVLDNDKEIWDAFENRYWPRKYIADHEGYLRYDHIGEGGYKETEKIIQQLLKERASSFGLNVVSAESLVDISEFEHTLFRTPELYFGYKFAAGRSQLGNSEGFSPNNIVEYEFPKSNIRQHNFYMQGMWKNLEGNMQLVSDAGSIFLPYVGKEVNIVTKNNADLKIYIDGNIIDSSMAGKDVNSNGYVLIRNAGLYNIVSSSESQQHTLQIIVDDMGFEIYTITFG